MNAMLKTLLLSLCLFLVCCNGFSQRIQFRNFNVKEGLAQSQVYDITSDKKGQLWMATRGGGISIYDGLNFKVLNHKNGLSNDFVFCFAKDNNQNIWIGTNDGLNYFDGKNIKQYFPSNLGDQVWIQKIAVDKHGRLWLATTLGLIKFENGKFENITEKLHLNKVVCNGVFIDKDSVLYFGNDFGLFRINIENGYNKAFKLPYGSTNANISVTCLLRSTKNELLVGTYGYGMFKVENDRMYRYLDTVIGTQEKILDLYEDKQTLYMATLEDGVLSYNFQNKKLDVTDERKGLSNNHVRKIYKDRNGNFWYGTSGGGVSNFGGQLFTHFDRQSGLPDNFIYSVLQTPDRKVWMGAGNSGLVRMSGDTMTVFNASNGFIHTKVKAIKAYGQNTLLIGTEGDGLYVYHDSVFQFVTGLGRQFIKDIEVANDGNIWLATAGNGIYRLKPLDASFNNFDIRQFVDHIINPRVQYLNTQLAGKVFYCTENQGIGLIENEQESGFRLNTGTGIQSDLTRSISIDKDGIAWIATNDKGVSAFDLTKKKPVPFDNPLLSSLNIYILQIDKNGNLILGTEKGLEHVFLDKKHHVIKIKHYGKGDGFLGIETCLNAVCANNDGSYWIGTIDGLTLYNPSKGSVNNVAPLLTLSGLKLFYNPIENTPYKDLVKSLTSEDTLVLPHTQNHLTFDFMGVNISNGEGVMYKWKLENFDADWSPVSAQHSVTYSNLPAGEYTLLINAANEDGIWDKKPLEYHFEIKEPFWKQWWFILIVLAVLIFIVYKFIDWRIQSIRREAAEKQHDLQMENQLQALEHKALRLQMNPHFIFNALNSIQSQIGNNNDQEARYYMAKFGKLMRQILNHSEQAWVDINEELEMVENYLLIEQFCHNKQFDYELKVEPELLQEEYKIPSMIIQPFIENAIKHGFKNLTERKAHLKLEIYLENDLIFCEIEDNGKGRDASVHQIDTSKHHSMAIGITKKRLQILHKNHAREFLTIVDLVNDGKPSGTLVKLILPFQ
jgi:ligand-binding sensor domain-containing protein/two-component sensor histidine kinase